MILRRFLKPWILYPNRATMSDNIFEKRIIIGLKYNLTKLIFKIKILLKSNRMQPYAYTYIAFLIYNVAITYNKIF